MLGWKFFKIIMLRNNFFLPVLVFLAAGGEKGKNHIKGVTKTFKVFLLVKSKNNISNCIRKNNKSHQAESFYQRYLNHFVHRNVHFWNKNNYVRKCINFRRKVFHRKNITKNTLNKINKKKNLRLQSLNLLQIQKLR